MSNINNFITDMLDQFPERYATKLFIIPDQVPYYGAEGSYGRSDYSEKVDRGELIEDLAALGITKHAVEYFLSYTTGDGIELVFKVLTILSERKLAGAQFHLIKSPSYALKDSLESTNPILESAYYQMPEFK